MRHRHRHQGEPTLPLTSVPTPFLARTRTRTPTRTPTHTRTRTRTPTFPGTKELGKKHKAFDFKGVPEVWWYTDDETSKTDPKDSRKRFKECAARRPRAAKP